MGELALDTVLEMALAGEVALDGALETVLAGEDALEGALETVFAGEDALETALEGAFETTNMPPNAAFAAAFFLNPKLPLAYNHPLFELMIALKN